MSSIAIITARGGSKRIPRKNIKDFLGKPIIAYSIQAALESKIFDEVMVSTDDKEIADIAISYGAKVPFFRSEKTADDYAGTADVLKEVLEEYVKLGKNFDWMCCIYPTAPFVTANKLVECMKKVQGNNANALIPVVKFSYPPQRSFILNEKKILEYKWSEHINKRSQDLEVFYHDAGQCYFVKVDKFLECNCLVPQNTMPYVVSELEVQDIDNEDDWKIAEIKYRMMRKDKGVF